MTVSRETHACAAHPVADVVSRETTRTSPLAYLLLGPIHLYRRLISPILANRCRYYPSCSSYAEEAIRELGATRGLILAAWRVLRCNPLSNGGLDPVSERKLFRPSPSNPDEMAA